MDIQEKLAALEKRVQDLETTEAVRNTIAQYAWAVDRKDWAGLEAIFSDDIVVENKWRNESFKGKEAVFNFFRRHRETFTFTHRISDGNEHVTVNGNAGVGKTYCIAMIAYQGESYMLGGCYEMHVRQEGQNWRIFKFINEVPLMSTLKKGWGKETDWYPAPPPLNEAK